MADQHHLDLIKKGVVSWNKWRDRHLDIEPDLKGVRLWKTNLSGVNLSGANLSRANLSGTILREANLSGADLSGTNLSTVNLNRANLHEANLSRANLSNINLSKANLSGANLSDTDLCKANLTGANLSDTDLSNVDLSGVDLRDLDLGRANLTTTNLSRADLSRTNLTGADLSGAVLIGASLVETILNGANLTGCSIYGISAWNVQLKDAIQSSLIITLPDEPTITVDNLAVAQFIYLLLNNENIRSVIDTITYKVVLILGRFTSERKVILNALREALRKQDYLPVLFDFEKPANRDLTETVSTLAHLARFIIVDLTDPSSAPHEVATIIPQCIVPVQPLLLQDEAKSRYEYGMFQDLRLRYHWVLPTHQYQDINTLLTSLKESVIVPAEQKAQELANR